MSKKESTSKTSTYMVPGFIDEIGAVQVSIDEMSESAARKVAEADYEMYDITNIIKTR